MTHVRALAVGLAVLSSGPAPGASPEPHADAAQAGQRYYVYACAESEDEVALLRFTATRDGGHLDVVKRIPVGVLPVEIEGPHGIAVHPDGRSWYVSISHGTPFGSIHKYATGTDEWLGETLVGLFPASMDVSRATGLLYVVNFNLYGDMVPSTVSVVDTASMSEVAQIPSGVMPHGSRIDATGRRHYHVTMMDDYLREIDTVALEEVRRLALSPHAAHAGHVHDDGSEEARAAAHEMHARMMQPTWATAPTREGRLYVMGNNTNEIVEVDVSTWEVTRRFENTHDGPYNGDVTPDGRTLVVTYKRGAAIGIWDLEAGREVARIRTTRTVPHGVVIAPDGRYAFVTNEGVGGEPGTVEVYDLASRARVAAADIGKQAGGVAFWRVE
jgi:DNA-binding beta-propeller fold protein YncE